MIATAIPSWQFGPPDDDIECVCDRLSDCCAAPEHPDVEGVCSECREHCGIECTCAADAEADDEAARERADEERAEARAARWER